MGAHSVVQLPGIPPEPSLPDLASRAARLEEHSPTGSLQSTHTVLTALALSLSEALAHLPDTSKDGYSVEFEESVAAIGAYLVHTCSLTDLPLGSLIAERFDRDEAELAGAARRRHRRR